MGRQTFVGKKINKDSNRINNLFLILYSIIITLPLLFRGGYFEYETLPILIGLNIVFSIWLILQSRDRDFKIFKSPIEILFVGIVILYSLSLLYGVNKRDSLLEFSKYFSYFAILIMTTNLSKEKHLERGILITVVLGGLLVSLVGIGSAVGTWDYNGAITGSRLSSTFQYPNTLAAYVGAVYFLALALLINENNRLFKLIWGFIMGTLIFTFALTFSRAMWLILPISLLFFFVILPNSRKLESILYMIGSIAISVPASFLFTRGMPEPNTKMWMFYLLASMGTGILVYIISLLEDKYRNIAIKKLLIVLSIICIITVAAGFYLISVTTEITLSNDTDNNVLSSLTRNISNIESSSNYELSLSYIGENTVGAPYLGRAIIYNINNKGETKQLFVENITEAGDNTLVIPFTTEADSLGIRVAFQNYYSDTLITIKESNVTDLENNKVIKNIPLNYKYIPENIISRISSISTGESSFTARILFNKDGLEIIKDYPILGTGGGGWETLYQSYQSSPYFTTLAHNYFIQLWIEVGILGLIFILGILFLLTMFSIRTYRHLLEDTNSKVLIVGMYITIFTMLLHALIDFDMSMSAYAIVLWVTVGLLIAKLDFEDCKIIKYTDKLKFLKSKSLSYITVAISLVLVFTMGSMVLSNIYAEKGVEASEIDKIGNVMLNFEKAVKYDKLEPTSKLNLANTYMSLYSATEDIEYAKKAIELMDKYIELSEYSSVANANAGNFYLSIGEIDKGLEHLEKSVEMQPLRTENYIQKADGYFAVFNHYFSIGEDTLARRALMEGLKVKEQIVEVNSRSLKPLQEKVDLVYKIGELQYFYDNIDNLQDLMDRDLVLDFAYYFDVDANSDGNIDMLRISKPDKSNIEYESVNDEEDSYIRLKNDGEVQGFIYPYGIKLGPNTNYVVDIKVRGTVRPETFRLYAWSNGSKEPNQGGLEEISLSDDWQIHSFEFTTDDDVKPGTQYIRIQHSGNDEGYIDIEELVIFMKHD